MYFIKRLSYLFLFITFSSGFAHAGVPTVSDVTVTDVTPVSFCVIWASNEPCTSDLNVFEDGNGTVPLTGITIESQPVAGGDSSIATSAENNGVMKVRVTGLEPDTTYYFQTVTISKSTSDITHYPDSAPMLGVGTESRVVRTEMVGSDEVPFTNDLIRFECYLPGGVTPAEGALLVAQVVGCDYPVSSFVGDGIAVPEAYVDLNNLFSSASYETRALHGGESLTLTRFMGIDGIESDTYFVPRNDQLAELKGPLTVPLCEGDFEPRDGDVDGSDLAVFAADFGRTDCGSGPKCEGDFDHDGDVDGSDLAVFAADFGRTDCP